jgi:pimeloyl-ACP methyl ester carboxylesterase
MMATRIELSHATLELDDVGQGHPVILLHGFPATRYLWSRVVPPLMQAGYRLLVPDLVGYGASLAPAGLLLDMASQSRWLLDKVGRPLAELLGARLAIVPGGHFTPLDCPAEVAAAPQGFLQANG